MSADFTSALFLGPVARASTPAAPVSGRPSVLQEPLTNRLLAGALARDQGAEDGLLARTSFHGLLDAIEAASSPDAVLLLDERAYPVLHWAAAAAAAMPGGPGRRRVLTYRHLSPDDASRRARRARGPVVVLTDGVCGSCLRPAPLVALAEVAGRTGGLLVVDDSLAAGILGRHGAGTGAFGSLGAGTPAWLGLAPDGHVRVASLAKGYGVPLAAVTGPAVVIERARRHGSGRTHASPPSPSDVQVLATLPPPPVLARRRRRLERLTVTTRAHTIRLGLTPLGIPFPVVSIPEGRWPALDLQRGLAADDVRVLVTVGRCTGRRALTVCLRADCTYEAVDRLLDGLSRQVSRSAA